MSGLAGVLRDGLSNFYDGNFSREMEDEVRRNGGVLSREDMSNYSVQVEQPVEGQYNEFTIQVPPPPSTGAALISALNLLEALQLNGNNNTENQTHRWIVEVFECKACIILLIYLFIFIYIYIYIYIFIKLYKLWPG
ncbi:Gamma-glutamyltransferase 7 [Liparis tanakae]|uniref:Gamma-glutamyltransferase 7 n=1 Tax=Liparis tanakae TaxID=230148 RepID=A0A4Z2GGC3_9TELE|nr:Gamma-glutamyltransferase 7 [Liparis tanakae]